MTCPNCQPNVAMASMADDADAEPSPPLSLLGAQYFPTIVSSLRGVRSFVRALAEPEFSDVTRLSDIELATSEIATNAIEHGTGAELFVSARSSQQQFVVEITSFGGSLEWQPGRPVHDQVSGRGLLIASTLADSMEIVNNPGTVVVKCCFDRDASGVEADNVNGLRIR